MENEVLNDSKDPTKEFYNGIKPDSVNGYQANEAPPIAQSKDLFENDETKLPESNSDFAFKLDNSMWASDRIKIKKNFKNTLEKYYNSSIEDVDFTNNQRATKEINNYVYTNTNGKIENLLQPDDLSPSTVML